VAADPRFTFELFRTFHHQSGLVLPLLLDDAVAGAFYFAWWKARKVFTERELVLAENVAALVTMVLRHVRLFERADREWRQLQVLYEISRAHSRRPRTRTRSSSCWSTRRPACSGSRPPGSV
jgi:GAF domain-containing protein